MLVDNFDPVYEPLVYYLSGTTDYAGVPLFSNYFYPQNTDLTWQAEWVNAIESATLMTMVDVTRLDWGDSLLAKKWTIRSKIRLEVRLYRDNDLGLKGYAMNHLEGEGITEIWGAADASPLGALAPTWQPYPDADLYLYPDTTVYSNCARLSLYETDALYGTVVGEPIFTMPVSDKYGVDGSTDFGAEVNVGGYAIYGYLLDAKARGLEEGTYRVIFSLDDSATWGEGDSTVTVSRNTEITGLDPADTGETSDFIFHSEYNGQDGHGTASWVDFELVKKSGGGKKQ